MSFDFEETKLEGVILVKPKFFKDERGFFLESYKKSEFFKAGIKSDFVQDNQSKSIKGVLRGLHYQRSPFEQAKLVRCIKGEVLDVAVDIRENSKNFGKWVSVKLSQENGYMLYLPRGFAHGFLTLSEEAEIVYKCDNEYSKEHDAGIFYNDETLNVDWGIPNPLLSEKDKKLPRLNFKNIEID